MQAIKALTASKVKQQLFQMLVYFLENYFENASLRNESPENALIRK